MLKYLLSMYVRRYTDRNIKYGAMAFAVNSKAFLWGIKRY